MNLTSVERLILEANGIAQHVACAGRSDAPAVLLLHGLGWDHTLWARQIDELAASGWRAIAPDLRGMGATAKPATPYSIGQYADDIAALLDALRVERCAVIGFSLGGMVALAHAAREPDRIAAGIFACCSPYTSPAGAEATEAMLHRAGSLGARRFAEDQARGVWHPKWAERHPAEVERLIVWRAAMDQLALTRAFRAAYGVDLRPELAGIRMPARVIVAAEDSFVSVETGRELAAALASADLVVIEDCGHMVSLERPAAFGRAMLEFLDQAWPGKAGCATARRRP